MNYRRQLLETLLDQKRKLNDYYKINNSLPTSPWYLNVKKGNIKIDFNNIADIENAVENYHELLNLIEKFIERESYKKKIGKDLHSILEKI